MSSRRTLIVGLVIGFLVAAVIGLAVALILVAGDSKKASDDGVATEGQTTSTSDDTTEGAGEGTGSDTGATEGTTGTKPRLVSYPSPRGAARAYARRRLEIAHPSDLTVNFSRSDSSYGIVTFFDQETPVAVWVRRQGAGGQGWVALAGNTTLSRAPKGLGIPDDLAVPFSD